MSELPDIYNRILGLYRVLDKILFSYRQIPGFFFLGLTRILENLFIETGEKRKRCHRKLTTYFSFLYDRVFIICDI